MLKNKYILKKSIYLNKIEKTSIETKKINLGKDNLLFKIIECGVCSSDLKFFFTGSRVKKYPIILGHEILAVKLKFNKKLNKFIETNQYAVFGAEIPCGVCKSCSKGHPSNMCDKPKSVGSNFDGGFSNYIIFNKKTFSKLPKVIFRKKNIKNICLSESVACVINALKIIDFNKNNSVLIIGSGYMGLLFVNLSKIFGGKNITVLDFNKKRLNIAKKLGAKNIIHIKKGLNQSIQKKLFSITNNVGFERVISSNSNLQSHEFAINQCAKLGKVNLYGGVPKSKDNKIKIDSNFVHYNQVSITGSFSSTEADLKEAFNLISKKKIKFDKMSIQYSSYNNFSKKLYMLKARKHIKSIFKP